jgi:hypothetical protein
MAVEVDFTEVPMVAEEGKRRSPADSRQGFFFVDGTGSSLS